MQTRSRSSLSRVPQTSNAAGRVPDAEHQAPAAPATSKTGGLPPRKSLPQLHALESGSEIERWQESFASEASHEDEGITTRLFRACLDSLTCILQHADAKLLSKRERNTLQRYQTTLKLWGDGHGVWDGRLDHVVDRSKNLQHMTLAVLNPMCKTLSNGMKKHVKIPSNDASMTELRDRSAEIYAQTKWLLSGFHEHTTDSDSGSDSDSSSSDELECGGMKFVVEDVKTYTNCLVDLSAALECPAIDSVHEDEPSQLVVEQRSAQDYHSDLIQAKFPDAKAELVQCLGETSWNRYQRMQQQRETANAQAHTQTQPTLGVKSHAADSEFQDSGLGTSLPSVALPTSYAETVISFMTSIAGGKRVQIPPLSAEAKNGVRFECVACGRHVRATTNRDWRKHLFSDLQPYTCFYDKCAWSSQPFADRQLWSNHLELDHKFGPTWDEVECPLCLEVTGSGKSVILIHFARHMEDISLAALPREVGSDAESDGDGENTSDYTASSFVSDTELTFDPCDICVSQVHKGENLTTHLQEAHKAPDDEIQRHILRVRWRYKDLSVVIPEIERLFSDENLRDNHLLRAQMDKEGFIPLEYLYEQEKLRAIGFMNPQKLFSGGWPQSKVFECRSDGENHKIRQRFGWEKWVEDRPSPIHGRGSCAELYRRKNEELLYLSTVRCVSGSNFFGERQIVVLQETGGPDDVILNYITNQQRSLRLSDTVITWTEPDGQYMELVFDERQGCTDIWDQIQDMRNADSEARNEQHDLETALHSPKLQESVVAPERSLVEPSAGQSLRPTSEDHLPNMPIEQEDGLSVQLQPSEVFPDTHERKTHLLSSQPGRPSIDRIGDHYAFNRPKRKIPWYKQWSSVQSAVDLTLPNLSGSPLSPGGSGEAPPHLHMAIDEEEQYTIKCICGFSEDGGATVLCETCDTWQHIVCFYDSNEHVPDVHKCVDCHPRQVDREAAAQKQNLNHEMIARKEERRRQRSRNPGRESPRPLLKSHTEASYLDTSPQVLDFEQWAFKPDVSDIPDAVSTSSQPLFESALNHAVPTEDTASTALTSSETANQDKKKKKRSTTACAECRASHVKCSFGQPCANCVRRKLPTCTYKVLVDDQRPSELPTIDLQEFAYQQSAEPSDRTVWTSRRTAKPDHSLLASPRQWQPGSTTPPKVAANKGSPRSHINRLLEDFGDDEDLAREAPRSTNVSDYAPQQSPLPHSLSKRILEDFGDDEESAGEAPHSTDPSGYGPEQAPSAPVRSTNLIERSGNVEQVKTTRDWETSIGDEWTNIGPPSESYDLESPTEKPYWDGSDYLPRHSAAGADDLLAEVRRLRQENEEKETRLRQLDSATSLPQKSRFINTKCYKCGQTGHWARNCPMRNLSQESRFSDDECYSCGQKGHWASNCPTRRNR